VGGILDLRSVKRVTLRAITTGLVRNLRGFAKGHEVPSRANTAAKKFIARLASDEIKADLDAMFQAVREAFGFKRKQLEASSEGGSGYLRTPRFEYRIHVEQDPSDPASIFWHREIAALKDLNLVSMPEFRTAFGAVFDILVLEFRKSIDVASLIDRVEEGMKREINVVCPSDAAWCEIVVGGFRGAIRVEPNAVRIEGRRAPPLPSLFDQFLQFIEK
jgi:hypothetical protein